jgi:hypothetical protein
VRISQLRQVNFVSLETISQSPSRVPTSINFALLKGLLVLGALWLLGLWAVTSVSPTWDVAWRLDVAHKILNGSVFYRDIVEVNPPLWFWSALPSVAVSEAFGWSPYATLCVAIYLLLTLALWLLDRCFAPILNQKERVWLVAGALVGLTLVPVHEFGQREPAFLLATLLWCGMAVRRSSGHTIPIWLVIGCTLFAAYGFALKHFFLMVPIGVELWLAFQLKRAWRPIRSENLLLAALGIIYGASVLVFSPEFLTDMVPLVMVSYHEVRAVSLVDPLQYQMYILIHCIFLLLPLYFARATIKNEPIAQVFFLSIILQLAAVFIQGKGFGYHFLAAQGLLIALWAYVITRVSSLSLKSLLGSTFLASLVSILWLGLGIANISFAKTAQASTHSKVVTAESKVVSLVAVQPQSSRIYITSANPGLSFYTLWLGGKTNYSRYFGMWMLPGINASLEVPERREAALIAQAQVRANMITDIQCASPHIIIDHATDHRRAHTEGVKGYKLKPMDIVLSDQPFRAWLGVNYVQEPETNDVTVWRSKSANGPAKLGC